MPILLKINGTKPCDINLDTVDGNGACLRHLYCGLTRESAERIAERIIQGDSLMLASLSLPVAIYEMWK
jgi:hypothetical protein